MLAEYSGQAGTPRPLTQTDFAWGLIHEGEGDYALARERYDEVLRAALGYGDYNHEICALIGGASARRSLGALQESLQQAQRAVAICHEHGCRVFEAEALVELAETHLALGNLARARQLAELHPVIPAKAGTQGQRAVLGPPGPPLSRR